MNDIDKLIELLGSESGDKWLEFMDYVNQNLSHILKRGKPKSEDIEQSIIGIMGFKSWGELVESPTQDGGLGWKLATFDSWKRAFAVVAEYQYLRNMGLTASFINTIHRETKPDFPCSEGDFKEFIAKRTDIQIAKHQNSLKDAQNRTQELEKEKTALVITIDQQNIKMVHIQEMANKGEALAETLLGKEKRIIELEILLKNALADNKQFSSDSKATKLALKNKTQRLNNLENKGLWGRLMFAFSRD